MREGENAEVFYNVVKHLIKKGNKDAASRRARLYRRV